MNTNEAKNLWNLIVENYHDYYNEREDVVQEQWEDICGEMGYHKISKGIETKFSQQFGSATHLVPDIILLSNQKRIADIELKQYSMHFQQPMETQLISYFKQFHISVGALVCSKLYVYSYDYNTDNVKKLGIDFIEDNENGIKFVEMFAKDNFSEDAIKEFVSQNLNYNTHVEEIVNDVLTPDFIQDIVRSFLSSDYTDDEIDAALSQVLINVSTRNQNNLPFAASTPARTFPIGGAPGTKNYNRYYFNGNVYGKSRLVLAVVQKYMQDHPQTSANILMTIFPKSLQGSLGVVAPVNSLSSISADPSKRFFVKSNELIPTSTEKCAVCTQWGIGNINKFIDKARALGMTIEEQS